LATSRANAQGIAASVLKIWRLAGRAYGLLNRRLTWRILLGTFKGWSDDNASTMAAAIAFYTVSSLPATLLLVVWSAGFVFGNDVAQQALLDQVRGLMGPRAADTIGEILNNATPSPKTAYAAIIGGATLVIGATTVFSQINQSLNIIWRADSEIPAGIWPMLKSRLLSVSVILAVGFLLLVSLGISAGISAMADYLSNLDKRFVFVVEAINIALSTVTTFVLFGMMYKILPTVRIRWRQVWQAALAAAVLFAIGKYLIAIYIGRSDVASIFGAASVIIVIILWVYYSVSIFLLGAEFSKAYSSVVMHLTPANLPAKVRKPRRKQRSG
jgi:membrane protein